MEHLRPGPVRSGGGGLKVELVDPEALRSFKKVYVVRSSARPSRSSAAGGGGGGGFASRAADPKKPSLSRWWNESADMKRRRRVAKYKLYCVEGKVKASIRRGYRWVKRRCSKIIHGF